MDLQSRLDRIVRRTTILLVMTSILLGMVIVLAVKLL